MSRRDSVLRKRIYALTSIMIVGLVISGVTAIPLNTEVDLLARSLNVPDDSWIAKLRDGIRDVDAEHPFLFYGMDWLAFGHIVIAVAFIGALRHPIRNRWLFDFGLIACAMVIPYALIMGAVRDIPLWYGQGWQNYSFLLLALVLLIAFAGVAANVRLIELLRRLSPSRLIARNVLFAWLAGNLFLGSQLCWIARPFVGSPGLPVQFIRPDALRGNFFEAVFYALKSLIVPT